MPFRIASLNLEQDHKRWAKRRPLIESEISRLKPDILALNEVCIPRQTARDLWRAMGKGFHLIQQTRVNGLADVEGEALVTRFQVIETANLDYRARDMVALVVRLLVDGSLVDVYVTHLYMSRGEDSLRLHQVQRLLSWIRERDDVKARIVCGDFNATIEMPSAALMATHFRATQSAPTAFTPLAEDDGTVSHPHWPRMDRCIDYIWIDGPIKNEGSGVCFNSASSTDSSLWPSDHAGVWADLTAF